MAPPSRRIAASASRPRVQPRSIPEPAAPENGQREAMSTSGRGRSRREETPRRRAIRPAARALATSRLLLNVGPEHIPPAGAQGCQSTSVGRPDEAMVAPALVMRDLEVVAIEVAAKQEVRAI